MEEEEFNWRVGNAINEAQAETINARAFKIIALESFNYGLERKNVGLIFRSYWITKFNQVLIKHLQQALDDSQPVNQQTIKERYFRGKTS